VVSVSLEHSHCLLHQLISRPGGLVLLGHAWLNPALIRIKFAAEIKTKPMRNPPPLGKPSCWSSLDNVSQLTSCFAALDIINCNPATLALMSPASAANTGVTNLHRCAQLKNKEHNYRIWRPMWSSPPFQTVKQQIILLSAPTIMHVGATHPFYWFCQWVLHACWCLQHVVFLCTTSFFVHVLTHCLPALSTTNKGRTLVMDHVVV